MRTLLPLLLALFTTIGQLFASTTETPRSAYDGALATIAATELNVGTRKSLNSSVTAAWNLYSQGQAGSLAKALKKVDQALKLIDKPKKNPIPPKLRDTLRSAIGVFKGEMIETPQIPTVSVSITTVLSPESTTGKKPKPVPAPAGAVVLANGVEVGVTGSGGKVTLRIPALPTVLTVKKYPSFMGKTEIDLTGKTTSKISVSLLEGKDVREEANLEIDESQDGVVSKNTQSFGMRFVRPDGSTAKITRVSVIRLLDHEDLFVSHLTALFSLNADGSLSANNLAGLKSILGAQGGKMSISVRGEDESGRLFGGRSTLYLGSYSVTGKLAAPPSAPGLNLGNVPLRGSILNTNLVFNVLTDGSGNFSFPNLPPGNFSFFSELESNGHFYYGQGTIVLNGNKQISVNMLGAQDQINGVPPFTQQAGILAPENAIPDEKIRAARAQETEERQQLKPDLDLQPFADGPLASVSVASSSQNVAVAKTATATIPQGTSTVILTYIIQSDEYPYYVTTQSIYNDSWSLSVRTSTNGFQLFSEGCQVNSQLSAPPLWQADGTTGELKKELDVSQLTASGPATLILFASSTNVGDSALPTRVNASLGGDLLVKINSITPDNAGPLNFHSIPREGEKNHFARTFTLDVTKPEGAKIKQVLVTLHTAEAAPVTVVDEPAGGKSVEIVDEKTLKVRVSFHDTPSTLITDPPPSHEIKYSFKLVIDAGGTEASDEKTSGTRRGLWRMPPGFDRYGSRDLGGDDWAAQKTYEWLLDHSNLISRIDDISGEHGRDIDHETHMHGTDIDIYHFYRFPNATSGGDNYTKLQADVTLAGSISPNASAARDRVAAWVSATRTGLDNLAANANVAELFYVYGGSTSGLPGGWAESLLKTGKTTVNNKELDVGTGAWSNSKYIPDSGHYNHIHITLQFSE